MNEWMNEYDMHKNKFVVCFRLLTRQKCELRPSESVKIKLKKLFKTIDASQSGASEFILFWWLGTWRKLELEIKIKSIFNANKNTSFPCLSGFSCVYIYSWKYFSSKVKLLLMGISQIFVLEMDDRVYFTFFVEVFQRIFKLLNFLMQTVYIMNYQNERLQILLSCW